VAQTELAAVTGLSRSQIQNIENSRSFSDDKAGNTTLKTLFQIAQALGVPVQVFLPQGVPQASYQKALDITWPQLQVSVAESVKSHALPSVTRPSPFVKPPVAVSAQVPLPVGAITPLPDIDQV
jgi:transcriptional regulator with XRE-family HTH domain